MKAATQSCSGKKPLSKFRQNPHYILEFQEHPFSRTPLNGCFCSKYCKKFNISLVKKKKKKKKWLIKNTSQLKKFDHKFNNIFVSATRIIS